MRQKYTVKTLQSILNGGPISGNTKQVISFLYDHPKEIQQIFKHKQANDQDSTIHKLLGELSDRSQTIATQLSIMKTVRQQQYTDSSQTQTLLISQLLENSLRNLQDPHFFSNKNSTIAISSLFFNFGKILKTDTKSREILLPRIQNLIKYIGQNVTRLIDQSTIDFNTISFIAGGLARDFKLQTPEFLSFICKQLVSLHSSNMLELRIETYHPILFYMSQQRHLNEDVQAVVESMLEELIKIKKYTPTELARLVNVIGRFRRISFDIFVEVIRDFEKMCKRDQVSISDINVFLDGVVQSKLYNGDSVVKKRLTFECPSLHHQLNQIQNWQQKDVFVFKGNYFGILRSISILHFMPISWYENQVSFIRKDITDWIQNSSTESLAFVLHSIVRINLNTEDSQYVVEAFFQHLLLNTTEYKSHVMSLIWVACVIQKYDHQTVWYKFIPLLSMVLDTQVEKLSGMEITQILQILMCLKLESPNLFNQLSSCAKLVEKAKAIKVNTEHFLPTDISSDFSSGADQKKIRQIFSDSYENQVIKILTEQYPQGVLEVPTGLASVDFYLPEINLCIEVDGSYHFYNLSKLELIKTTLKYRLMEKAGLNVLRLVHHDYKLGKVVDKEKVISAVTNVIESIDKTKIYSEPSEVFYNILLQNN